MLKLLNGETYCSLHQTTHPFNLTAEQLCLDRYTEFMASARDLGVDKVFIMDNGRDFSDSEPYTDYEGLVKRILDVIRAFESFYPGASL